MFKKNGKYDIKFLLLFLVLLIGSGACFYFLVFAESDDDNKFTINNISISAIQDGDGALDPDNNAGNDSSYSNGIVRNFDSIKYSIKYNLEAKDPNDSGTNYSSDQRPVIIDVLFPSSVNGQIWFDSESGYKDMTQVFNNEYKYTSYQFNSEIGSDKVINFSLANINMQNNSRIPAPIVIVREATDEDSSSISTLTDDERGQSYDSVSNNFHKNEACALSNCQVSVSGIEDYYVTIHKGTQKAEGLETVFPIGYRIGLEDRYIGEEPKGIKGLQIPQTVNFNVTWNQSNASTISYDSDYGVKNYNTNLNYNGFHYTIYTDSNNSSELEEIKNAGNEYIGLVSGEYTDKLEVNVQNIYYSNNNVLSTGAFIIKSTRSSYTQNTEDINVRVTATRGTSQNYIDLVDKLGRYVGTYESKITLKDTSGNAKKDGLAAYLYGEEMLMDTYFQYGMLSGNNLESLTNYIKIDNDAFRLTLNDNNMEAELEYTNPSSSTMPSYKVYLGYGKWNTDYLTIKQGAPSGCPASLESASKQDLMNLYGGPCIETTNSVKWVEHIDDEHLTDDEKKWGPMIIKTVIADTENETVEARSAFTLKTKLMVKNSHALAGTSHQIVSNGVAAFKNTDGNINNNYYLSNTVNQNGIALMSNANNYVITNYNYSERKLVNDHSTTCSGENPLLCAVTGNTVLIGGLLANKPTIETYYNNVPKTEFYYYPIEWRINAQAYKAEELNFEKAYLEVFLPKTLVRKDYGTSAAKQPIHRSTTIDGEQYDVYLYSFDSTEIKNGQITDFSVYTDITLNTPNFSTPKVYAYVSFEAKLESEDITFTNIAPKEDSTAEVTIHNYADISTQGSATPTFFNKNGYYEYNMVAYNNSHSSQDEGYDYTNANIIYVLPYNGDSSFKESSSNFNSTGYKIRLNSIPDGFKAYYTEGNSANIISNEIDTESTNQWIEWTNPTQELNNPRVTAIRIERLSAFTKNSYFSNSNGITVRVTPIGSGMGDTYYNSFYVITDRPDNVNCDDNPDTGTTTTCDNVRNSKIYYSSSKSSTSVFNRQVSGLVFEDYNYSGLFESDENKMENIPVSLCKLKKTEYTPTDPTTYVTDEDECDYHTETDSNGRFIIRDIQEGKYYLKFTYNNEKYTVTDPYVNSQSGEGSSTSVNSKAYPYPDTNIAISSIIDFTSTDNNMIINNMNLGLKIRKQFAVDIKKFITKTKVTTNGNTKTYDYDKATKVTVNLRNPKDAHIRVKYDFIVQNTKYFPGYIGLITDVMPVGMTFDSSVKENQDWIQYGNTLFYNGLSKKLIIPGEKYYFSLVLDLDVTEGGDYINFASASDLILMGDDIPIYDFITNTEETNTENNDQNTNTGEGN